MNTNTSTATLLFPGGGNSAYAHARYRLRVKDARRHPKVRVEDKGNELHEMDLVVNVQFDTNGFAV